MTVSGTAAEFAMYMRLHTHAHAHAHTHTRTLFFSGLGGCRMDGTQLQSSSSEGICRLSSHYDIDLYYTVNDNASSGAIESGC